MRVSTRTAIVNGNCYIRSAPNTDGKILGVAHKGEQLTYGGAVSSGGWLLVEHKGQNAWVSGKYGKLECALL
ncbi:MAG: SH3 domain-containing protein [Clostridia bacterium]|nr:SH3 domain-containing protein [Clostridia bacterium]